MTDNDHNDAPDHKAPSKGRRRQRDTVQPEETTVMPDAAGELVAEGGVPDWPPADDDAGGSDPRVVSAQAIDAHVGTRILALRQMRDISQHQLGEALGLTFQQIQKYERGMNRISAGRLFMAARFLRVPVSYFFEGLPTGARLDNWMSQPHAAEAPTPFPVVSPVEDRQLQDLLVAYARISDPARRRALATAIRNIADAFQGLNLPPEGSGPPLPPRRRRGRPPKKRD